MISSAAFWEMQQDWACQKQRQRATYFLNPDWAEIWLWCQIVQTIQENDSEMYKGIILGCPDKK